MDRIHKDISHFRACKDGRTREAQQRVALQLACGIDLHAALNADIQSRQRLAIRLERMIERERLRGSRAHWSYDLNRHIALKQFLDRIRSGPQHEQCHEQCKS